MARHRSFKLDKFVSAVDNEATIKEFHSSDNAIILRPCSTNKQHQPIILTRDFQIQGVVVTSVPKINNSYDLPQRHENAQNKPQDYTDLHKTYGTRNSPQ